MKKLQPPPSLVELVTDTYDGDNSVNKSKPDSIWKKWLSNLHELVSIIAAGTTVNGKLLNDSDSPYSATSEDNWLFCNPLTGDITVNLPAGTEWRTFFIKNYVPTGSNAVIVIPNGVETIEGSTSLTLNRPNSSQIVYLIDDSNWVII